MEAPVAQTSSIKVHFGDKVHKGAASPLYLSLVLDFFSKEVTSLPLRRNKLENDFLRI